MSRNLAFLLGALALFGQTIKETPAKTYEVPEAYEVYAAALALDHVEGDESRELLIADTTVPFSHCLETRSDRQVDAAIEDYKKANRVKWLLERKLKLGRTYKLLSTKEIEALRLPDPQGGFFWRFPEAVRIRSISAVGFNANKTVAVVEMDFECGGQCGHGAPFILQKHKGEWRRYSPPPPPLVKNPDGTYTVEMSGGSACQWSY
jgi:hypothetical protein